ncbi:MAG TPA: hypothetical protein VG389_18030 [Myxococcota bacterium]|jgi:hypothetical protein|nr:hypothetical protein [Myxococcota bacterium]
MAPAPDASTGAAHGASKHATGTAVVSRVCVFVHDDVQDGLARLGLPRAACAGVVVFDGLLPAPVVALLAEASSADALLELRTPPPSMEAQLRAVCIEPPAPTGLAASVPVPHLDWAIVAAKRRLRTVVALAGADRRIFAWIPYAPSPEILSGAATTDTVAVLSVRGVVQPVVLEGPLLNQLAEGASAHAGLSVEDIDPGGRHGDRRELVLDLSSLGRGAPRHTGELRVFLELEPDVQYRALVGGWPHRPPVERAMWRSEIAELVAVPYGDRSVPPADAARYQAWGADTYNDAWKPSARKPLWEHALGAPAGAPGFAVALWACAPAQRLGTLSLAAEAELAWSAAGVNVKPLVTAKTIETRLRLTPLERLATLLERPAPAAVEHAGKTLTIAELMLHGLEKVAHHEAEKITSILLKSYATKAARLVELSRDLPHLPGSAEGWLRRISASAGSPGLLTRELRLLGPASAEGLADATHAIAAAERWELARRAGRAAGLAESLKAIGLLTDLLAVADAGVAGVGRAALAAERARAEESLSNLLELAAKDPWTSEEAFGASLAALGIERALCEAPEADAKAFLSGLGLIPRILGHVVAPPAGMVADALLLVPYLIELVHASAHEPPERLGELAGACAARLLLDVFALACVVGAAGAPDVVARNDGYFGLIGDFAMDYQAWTAVFDRLEGLARRAHGSVRRDLAPSDPVGVKVSLLGTTPGLRKGLAQTLQRSVGFWLRRCCIHALAASDLGQTAPDHWRDLLAKFLWGDAVELRLQATADVLVLNVGGATLAVPLASLPGGAADPGWRLVRILQKMPLAVRADPSLFASPWSAPDPGAMDFLNRLAAES